MKGKFKIRKFVGQVGRCFAAAAVMLVWLGSHKAVVNAAADVSGADASNSSNFTIEAELLPGGDGMIYDVRVTVQNGGADWEGTVRISVEDRYISGGCAYDTELSLPAGSRKQFTMKIQVVSLDNRSDTTHIKLLDKKGNQVADRTYTNFLSGGGDALSMGILSDDYAALTYLDMGGSELYYYNDLYPVKLVELNLDNLSDQLDSLVFLVIDRYSTEVLTEEQHQAVREWNEDGGVLILGTGAYAEDTLGGFDEDYIGVNSIAVYPPGENRPSMGNGEAAAAQKYGLEIFVETQRLTIAALRAVLPDSQTTYNSGGFVRQLGDGVVSVLPYSLSELGSLGADAFHGNDRNYYISLMLDEISAYSQIRYSGNIDYYDLEYQRNRLFGILSNSGNVLNFGVLRVIVILYVIFVGPVLYLILKLLKKRELYWAAVPVAAVLGIVVVYVAGRGFEVKGTKVYSVTVEGVAGTGRKQTYLQCFDAGRSEWMLKLSGDYEYVGPIDSNVYFYSKGDYYQHVRRAGNELYFGINPEGPFENCRFLAGGAGTSGQQGSVRLQDIEVYNQGVYQGSDVMSGTVVNDTGKDFSCFALIVDGNMCVYGSLPAGESRNLADLVPIYVGDAVYGDYGDYASRLRHFYSADRYKEEIDALAALGIGVCGAAEEVANAEVFFMGVTENYERAVDDVCNEVSYGCLYAVEYGEEQNALY